MMTWTPPNRKVFRISDHPYALEALMVTREGAILGVMHGELVLIAGEGTDAIAMSVDPDAWADTVVACYLPVAVSALELVPDNETLDMFEDR